MCHSFLNFAAVPSCYDRSLVFNLAEAVITIMNLMHHTSKIAELSASIGLRLENEG